MTGDADRIEQIISNLLSNAVKFTVSGSIGFSAVYRNDILTITVRDTGIGMSEETIRRIFTPLKGRRLRYVLRVSDWDCPSPKDS